MLKAKSIKIKNFMSFGNVEEEFDLDTSTLTLILGENRDVTQDGSYTNSRNGAGKTTILFAIFYALYDGTIGKIKKENLINKINKKDMRVTFDFEVHNNKYRIIRGRKPNILKLYINDKEYDENKAQGQNKDTQSQINEIVGISSDLAKHILALNTYVEPFLSQTTKVQRDLIEELLGFDQLSKKADVLKHLIKENKLELKNEKFKIETLEDINKKTLNQISKLEKDFNKWNITHSSTISDLNEAIEEMSRLNINEELNNHKLLSEKSEITINIQKFQNDLKSKEKSLRSENSILNDIQSHLENSKGKVCHTCGQNVDKEKHEEITSELNKRKEELESSIETLNSEISDINSQISYLQTSLKSYENISTFYNTEREAWDHQNTINTLNDQLEKEINSINPYESQIESLKNESLQDINYEKLTEYEELLNHQEFLLKMLTNKDSFVRKRIIDQNISYLNHRLNYYLERIGLPHKVKFLSDLDVEITKVGNDYDFDNLSRGERNRVSLSLSWAFRDVYESINNPINFIFIDEMLDNGLDGAGLENCISILKDMNRNGKSVFLISHKEELQPRVNNIINVVLENSFSTIEKY